MMKTTAFYFPAWLVIVASLLAASCSIALVEAQSSILLLITEIADPSNNEAARYVELYAPQGAGQTVTENLYLIKYEGSSRRADLTSAVSLRDATIGLDGFLVVCASATGANAAYGTPNACDVEGGVGGPVDSDGNDQIALVKDDLSFLDMFGVVGQDGAGTNHNFANGRAERKSGVTEPQATWTVNEWNVFSDAPGSAAQNVANMDPRQWTGAVGFTPRPTVSPTVGPTNSPVGVDAPTVGPISSPTFSPSKSPTTSPTTSPVVDSTATTNSPVKSQTSSPPTVLPAGSVTVAPSSVTTTASPVDPASSSSPQQTSPPEVPPPTLAPDDTDSMSLILTLTLFPCIQCL